jgi:hypothetical protein
MQRSDDEPMINTYDRAWSYVGQGGALVSLSLAWYARSGAFPIIPTSNAQDDMRVSASFWGLLLDAGALSLLGLIVLRYVSKRSAERRSEPPWPRLTTIEEENRDVLFSRVSFAAIVGIPFMSWIVCALKYADSYITPKWGMTTKDALAQSFWLSRIRAFTEPSSARPLRIYPPHGIEYIPWLTDTSLALLTLSAVIVWTVWLARLLEERLIESRLSAE